MFFPRRFIYFHCTIDQMYYARSNGSNAHLAKSKSVSLKHHSSRLLCSFCCCSSTLHSSWLHLKGISVHIAATLRASWALLFWPTWPAAVNWTLLLDERSFSLWCGWCLQFLKATAIFNALPLILDMQKLFNYGLFLFRISRTRSGGSLYLAKWLFKKVLHKKGKRKRMKSLHQKS